MMSAGCFKLVALELIEVHEKQAKQTYQPTSPLLSSQVKALECSVLPHSKAFPFDMNIKQYTITKKNPLVIQAKK